MWPLQRLPLLLIGTALLAFSAHAQLTWRFHLAFEDGSGARDTLWFIYDTTGTVGSDFNPVVDDHLSEGAVEMDLEAFNVWTWNWQYDSTKTQAWPYFMYPMAEMPVMAFNYVAPVTIRWDRDLFNAPELPTAPHIGHAILGGEYFFWTGLEDPLVGGFNMLAADSVLIQEPAWMFVQTTMIFGESSGLGVGEAHIVPLRLYPNPAMDRVMRVAPAIVDRMEVMDAGGRVVHVAGPLSSGGWKDVAHLPAGSYAIHGIAMDGSRYHGKFIKV